MSKSIKWRDAMERFHRNVDEVMSLLGVDNDVNLLRKVKGLQKELAAATSTINEFVDISQTGDQGEAKNRFKALMKVRSGEEYATLPPIFMVAPTHWRTGIAADRKKGIKGEPPMLPRAAERKLRREVHPYLSDLWTSLQLLGEVERTRIQEDVVESFNTLPPAEFINKVYNYVNNLDDLDGDEEIHTVPLADMLHYCIGLYPDQLLEDCRQRASEAGTIGRSWFDSFDIKFAAATTADEREALARTILVRFLYRLSGGVGLPLPSVESELARLLSTERWQLSGPEWVVNENTRLTDLIETLTYTPQ